MSYQLCKQSVIRQLLPLAGEHRRLSQTEVIQPTIEQRDLLKVPSWVSVCRWEAACCIPRRASIRGQTPNSELREFGVWSRICLSAVCLMAAGGERGVRVQYDVAVHVGDAHEGAVVCSRFSGIHECELDGCAGHAVIAADSGTGNRIAWGTRTAYRDESFEMEVIAGIPRELDIVRQITGVAVNFESVRDVRKHRQAGSRHGWKAATAGKRARRARFEGSSWFDKHGLYRELRAARGERRQHGSRGQIELVHVRIAVIGGEKRGTG